MEENQLRVCGYYRCVNGNDVFYLVEDFKGRCSLMHAKLGGNYYGKYFTDLTEAVEKIKEDKNFFKISKNQM